MTVEETEMKLGLEDLLEEENSAVISSDQKGNVRKKRRCSQMLVWAGDDHHRLVVFPTMGCHCVGPHRIYIHLRFTRGKCSIERNSRS